MVYRTTYMLYSYTLYMMELRESYQSKGDGENKSTSTRWNKNRFHLLASHRIGQSMMYDV